MSRREEVESVINCTDWCNGWEGEANHMHHIARTLATEIDAYDARIAELEARDNIKTFAAQEVWIHD